TVVACCPRARSQGVAPGLTASAAQALALDLIVHPRDEIAERATLEGVATWAQQFTPTACLAPPDTVLLETGGSLRLFGGMEPLATRLRAGLQELGLAATIAAAPTALGAELLARGEQEALITDAGALQAALEPLPLALLDLDAATLDSLAGVGAETLGEYLRLPRDGLARRYGQALADTFDRALGRLPDPRQPFVPPRRFAARLELPAPVADAEALVFGLRRMLAELCGWLAGRGEGVTRLGVTLEHERRSTSRVAIRLAVPSRDSAYLTRLARERLGATALAQPVGAVGIAGEETAPLASATHSLFGDAERVAEDRELLLTRLRARLGDDAVTWLAPFPDHRPERAHRESETAPAGDIPRAGPRRPLWLLPSPRPLASRDGVPLLDAPLALLAGPERIESGWWDGADVVRDYYVARNGQGETFWVFRDRRAPAAWYLHGIFA
ncbi:MAG TPA: DNA polymerase Y family protein, partial [Pelomicrobium sp.]|nr:DNA polymerase Y family protein [Pelomicrobium sp.]